MSAEGVDACSRPQACSPDSLLKSSSDKCVCEALCSEGCAQHDAQRLVSPPVVVGWLEGVFCHCPARREDNKVSNRNTCSTHQGNFHSSKLTQNFQAWGGGGEDCHQLATYCQTPCTSSVYVSSHDAHSMQYSIGSLSLQHRLENRRPHNLSHAGKGKGGHTTNIPTPPHIPTTPHTPTHSHTHLVLQMVL